MTDIRSQARDGRELLHVLAKLSAVEGLTRELLEAGIQTAHEKYGDEMLTDSELIASQIGLLTKAVLLLVKEYRDAHPVWHGGPR